MDIHPKLLVASRQSSTCSVISCRKKVGILILAGLLRGDALLFHSDLLLSQSFQESLLSSSGIQALLLRV